MKPEEAEFIWSLMPVWVREIPGKEHSWDPMWFGTLSRDGDIKVSEKVKRILKLT